LKCSYSASCAGCELENDETVFSFTDSQYSRDSRAGFCIQWAQDAQDFDGRAEQIVKDKSLEAAVAQKQDCIDLFDCIKAFTKEEILSEQDPWYCSKCKDFRQASKKFDIWTLPAILIIHMKRFSYTRLWRDKISTLVDFPIDGLDMSPYVVSKEQKDNAIYDLFAVSNHMGGMGGGHYTAYCKNLSDHKWYCYDDSRVSTATESDIKSDSAYVLFYQRRDKGTKSTSSASASQSKVDSSSSFSSSSSSSSFSAPHQNPPPLENTALTQLQLFYLQSQMFLSYLKSSPICWSLGVDITTDRALYFLFFNLFLSAFGFQNFLFSFGIERG